MGKKIVLFLSPHKLQRYSSSCSSRLIGVRGNVWSACCQNLFQLVIREDCCCFIETAPHPPPVQS